MASDIPMPEEQLPSPEWEHYTLYSSIKEMLQKIPEYFHSTISVSRINATGIYTFSTVLGATIEQEIVSTLNRLRYLWENDSRYCPLGFVECFSGYASYLCAIYYIGALCC